MDQLPSHSHQPKATDDTNLTADPSGRVTGHPAKNIYRTPPDNNLAFNAAAIASAGGSQSHSNLMPFLCIHFIIALFGIYPSRQ